MSTIIREPHGTGIRGSDPAARLALRQERSAPILSNIDAWLTHYRARASAKSPLGEALAYIAKYRDGLGRLRRVPVQNPPACSQMATGIGPVEGGRYRSTCSATGPCFVGCVA